MTRFKQFGCKALLLLIRISMNLLQEPTDDVIKAQSGKMQADSKEGDGTEFIGQLPT